MSEAPLKCPLCSGTDFLPFITLPDANGVPTKLWQCLDCYCHIPASALDSQETSTLESQVRFHEKFWSQCTSEEMVLLRADLYDMVSGLRDELGQPSPANRIIEIGCGRGGLLRALIDHGYNALGCEPALGLVAMAQKYFALDEDTLFAENADAFLDRIIKSGGTPDVIVMWHVLEHVSGPLKLLRRCAEILPPNGKLVLQLPLLHSPYIYPEHNFFVTPQTFSSISQYLDGFSYHFDVDSPNKFVTVVFKRTSAEQETRVPVEEDALWRGSSARAEPILTRDLAIDNLNKALRYQQRSVPESQGSIALLLNELDSHKRAADEKARRLEWHARVDEKNALLLKSVSSEAGELKGKLTVSEARIAELEKALGEKKNIITAKNEAIDAQVRMIEERWDAMQNMGNEIHQRNQSIRRLEQEIAGLRDTLQQERVTVDWLQQDNNEKAQSLKYRSSATSEYLSQLRRKSSFQVLTKFGLVDAPPDFPKPERSTAFGERKHNRYWWHHTAHTRYVPVVYDSLEHSEWMLLNDWFDDTEKKYTNTGEANIPPLSLLFGLISGNGMSRIVQCGHYVGYSTLLLGFLLRRMGKSHALYSIDIDPEITAYTADWVSRAGLSSQVMLSVNDSAAGQEVETAERYLGGAPQLVFIDSSHQYEHTLRELHLWYAALCKGGFMVLHDISKFAASLDHTGNGGVGRAVNEWCAANGVTPLMLNSFVSGGTPGDYPYLDGCGLAIIQKS